MKLNKIQEMMKFLKTLKKIKIDCYGEGLILRAFARTEI